MGVKAAEKELSNAETSVDDLDVIVFASNTPEYLSPSNALLAQYKLDAKNAKVIFDINCDCAGVTLALDIVTRLQKTNKRYKKGIVVGSVMMSAWRINCFVAQDKKLPCRNKFCGAVFC